MELLWMVLMGAIIGTLAKLLMPGSEVGGFIVTGLLGVFGAFVAFAIGRALGLYTQADEAHSIIAAVVGAVLVLFIYRVLANPRVQI